MPARAELMREQSGVRRAYTPLFLAASCESPARCGAVLRCNEVSSVENVNACARG